MNDAGDFSKETMSFDNSTSISFVQANSATHLAKCALKSEEYASRCFTGIRAYSGAHVMCSFIHQNSAFFAGKRVFEIGCGVGLPGLLAARFCASVVLADREPDALELARKNIELQPKEMRTNIETCVLEWTPPSARALVGAHGCCDILVGTDLIYRRVCLPDLFQTAFSLLKNDGVLFMAFTPRISDAYEQMEGLCETMGLEAAVVEDPALKGN